MTRGRRRRERERRTRGGEREEREVDTVFKSSKQESHTTALDRFVNVQFHHSMNGVSSKISYIKFKYILI